MLSDDKLPEQTVSQLRELSAKFIRNLAITNADTLYAEEDKALLNLEKFTKTSINPDVIFLQPEFKTEAFAESFSVKRYLNAKDRKDIQVVVKNGHFLDAKGKPLWGEYIYGLLPDNRLYVLPVSSDKHHSHILAGLPAKAVGHAHFVDGKLILLSNNSGHYKPTAVQMRKGIEWFYKQNQCEFVFEDHEKYSKKMLNHGLRYRHASEIITTSVDEPLVKTISMDELADMMDSLLARIRNKRKALAANKNSLTNGKQNSYELIANESDSESENCGSVYYSGESDMDVDVIEEVAVNSPVVKPTKSLESMRTSLMFTHALEGYSRFRGTKNLKRFEAKAEEEMPIVDSNNQNSGKAEAFKMV